MGSTRPPLPDARTIVYTWQGPPEIHRQEFFSGCVAQHADHRFVNFQKLTVETAAANAVVQISGQGAVTCFRPSQFLFGSISCIAQHLLILSAMDGHREMADATHFNTIAGALQNEFCNGFTFHEVDQVDERDLLLHLAQAVQCLSSLPVGARVFGKNKIEALRTKPVDKLVGSYNDIGSYRESHPLELVQTALDIRQGTMNEEDAQEMLSALQSVQYSRSFQLFKLSHFTPSKFPELSYLQQTGSRDD
jgi:hypothetical protein